MRRFRPLAVVQLVAVLVLIYTGYWYLQLRVFKKEMAALLSGHSAAFTLTADDVSYSGFPYRLQLVAHNARLVRAGPDFAITLLTSQLVLVRQPWQSLLYLGFADHPTLSLRTRGVEYPLLLEASAEGLEASLHLSATRVERLSLVLHEVVVTSNTWFADVLRAHALELHGREPDARPGDAATARSIAELLVQGRELRLGDGPPATLEGHLTAFGPMTDSLLAHWAQHGFLALDRFSLRWPTGSLVAQAKMSFDPEGHIRAEGVMTTTAPSLLRAALAGQSTAPLGAEKTTPTPIRFAIANTMLNLDGTPLRPVPAQLFAPLP